MKNPLTIISEVNQTLALSNECQMLLEMVLDTLLEVMEVDCCWIQLLDLESGELRLAAHRGFTPDMEREIGSPGLEPNFINRVSGLGYKIVLSDLSKAKDHGLTSFIEAGLRAFVAVPLKTYHPQGVMGIAALDKRRFHKETLELLMVIANLIGTALDKAELYQRALASAKQANKSARSGMTSISGEDKIRGDWEGELEEVEKVIQINNVDARSEPEDISSNDKLWLNPEGNEVRVNGHSISLTSAEYKLLYHLVSNEGVLLSYEELFTKVWGNEHREVVPFLRMNMQHLKQKLVNGSMSSSMIIDELGGGYRFVDQFEEIQL